MRLAFCLFRYFPFSGLARDMLHIADTALERGHQIHILTEAWQGEPSERHTVEIIPTSGASNHGRALSFSRAVQSKLLSSKYDRILGFNKMHGLDIYYAADPCFVSRIRYTRKNFSRLTPRYRGYRRLEQAVFQQGARTRCLILSERAKHEYQEFYGTEDSRFTIMPPNLAMAYKNLNADGNVKARVRTELGVAEHENVVLMVGSGYRTKGVDRAIQALAALPPDLLQTTRLLIAGEGKVAPYLQLASTCNVEKRVHFLGARDDVPDLMCAATLLTHPAYNENTGTVLLEAMAAGLPVLTTDICGYAHHVTAAGAGCVLKTPFDQAEFNKALVSTLRRDNDDWSANGRSYVRQPEFYSMPETVVDIIEQPRPEPSSAPPSDHEFVYLSHRLNFGKSTSFEDVMALEGKVYRQVSTRRTVRFLNDGKGYFLKAHYGVGWREILKNLLYLKNPVLGADNEWHALHFLNRIGIEAPAPHGYGHRGSNPARRRSFIIMEEILDAISLEDLASRHQGGIHNLRLKRALVSSLAKIARSLHLNGTNHRDFYLCHFLVSNDLVSLANTVPLNDVPLTLIDLHRAQIRRKTPGRWIVKDLGGLYYSSMDTNVTRRDLLRFIKVYSACPLRVALKGPVNWNKVERRAQALRRSEKAATG